MHTGTAKNHIVLIMLLAVAVAFSPARVVHAHETGGSFQRESGNYTIDIGYNPASITARDYASFDFLLWKGAANTAGPADYSHVWTRIIRDKETLLVTGILHQTYGPTILLYAFPDPGMYTIEVSYRTADGDEIAAASFPVTVAPAPDQSPAGPYLPPLLGLFAGIAIGFFLTRLGSRFRAS